MVGPKGAPEFQRNSTRESLASHSGEPTPPGPAAAEGSRTPRNLGSRPDPVRPKPTSKAFGAELIIECQQVTVNRQLMTD